MKILIGKGGQVEVLLIFKETEQLDKSQELYDYLKEREIFKAASGEVYSDISPKGNNIILLGLGEKEKLTLESLRKAFYTLGKELMKYKVESAEVEVPKFENLCYKETNMAIAEGLLQSEYAFEKYLSEQKTKPTVKEFFLNVLEDKKDKVEEGIEEINNIIEGIFLARDLINEPAIVMTPKELAIRAKEELSPLGVEVEVFGEEKIEELGMKSFLAVSKGSANEPQFIIMKWNGNKASKEKLALVGKGLTYDSGGYSIKPSEGMATMYVDMAGSGVVIGAMKSIAKSKLNKNVVAIVAACENLISGEAYKPGDIIGSMAGKTIEVLNTDAEGRLTLADALYYAATIEKADKIVDVATLTGACIIALGSIYTGAITNNEEFMSEVEKASKKAGEPVWQLPSNDEYRDLIKGTTGDLKNVGGRQAGTITAGLFLEEFVNDIPWVHLDIAGTSYLPAGTGYLPKGATGVSVKTLYNLAKDCNCSCEHK
ncbi:leucyl aminopeptidase [Tissierella sp. MB52-C2]|uniref:leucyl aminopeptidase n=1 Tax=Tissierella sp. MB52-C2 TaxID=3070999 RepID=UPI00280B784D|nr:leucyl aminopeptidase [Tissierella sp. MB52-C2]WMM24445.1 leucyl aminopeptidase [Tissierella sp. MB52-C2]